jgi:pimeloyl-ACP methyl ester carboxylesterase
VEIQLADKRILAYAEYGDPAGSPVFFFHGIPGSRIFRPPDEITAKMGVRLICIDRPGYGLSTFQPNRRILDWPQDVTALADHLGLEQFAVAGHSGGCPYVCACAHALPQRVSRAVILSGMGPAEAPHTLDNLMPANAAGLRFGRYIPWALWYPLMWAFYREGRDHPEKLFPSPEIGQGARGEGENPDNAVFAKFPGVLENCRASTSEAFRQGWRGHAWDGYLLVHPWGFRLDDIQIPVWLWHGAFDQDTSIHMGRYLAQTIPNCHATFCPGEGHLLLMNHWQEILSALQA